MRFTIEDYKQIEEWLARKAVKDTEFSDAITPFKGQEYITLVQGDQNVKILIKDLVKEIFALGIPDFLNLTSFYGITNVTLEEAIKYVPSTARKVGLYITFKGASGFWETYQFAGDVINQWNTLSVWKKSNKV